MTGTKVLDENVPSLMNRAPCSAAYDENVDEEDERHKQKGAKHEGDGVEQEVTDPVTHSSVTKHDITRQELKHTLENMPLTDRQQLSAGDV